MSDIKTEQIIEIKKEIKRISDKYLGNAIEIFSDFNAENKTKRDYKGRQIYELMQNADDCFSDACSEIDVKIIIRDNLFIIENTGSPFDYQGITSLMHTDASSKGNNAKHKNTIGYKGLGFRSVLNWSNEISIYTKEFNVHFSEERAKDLLAYYKNHSEKTHIDRLDEIDRTAILTSAAVDNDLEEKNKYLEDDYSTSIVLACQPDIIDSIQKQLIDLQFEELLFLKHITTITIISPAINRVINSVKGDGMCGIEENGETTWWNVWIKEGSIPQINGEEKKYELALAYNANEEKRELTRQKGVLYSYFKTDMPMPLPFLIHGTFELSSERNKLIKDDENNRKLLQILINFIIEKSVDITKKGGSSYEALKFAIPSKEVYFLDDEYNFTNNIKEQIKKHKVLPSISGEYLSLEDNPKYSDLRFDLILNKERFKNLLIHCDDEQIKKYLMSSGVGFYSYQDFCANVVKDADEYIDNNLNIEIIKLYCLQYPYAGFGPYLLTDSHGDRIVSNTAKIFNNPTTPFDLPSWSQMRFINQKLEDDLSEALEVSRGRDLVNKLSIFNLEEYAFDKVVNELNRQCDTLDKIKSLLHWLYQNWIDNNQNFQSSLSTTSLKIITRDNDIILCDKAYFGEEYNNPIGAKIIKVAFSDNCFIASQSELGFGDVDPQTFIDFLKRLGVSEYPRIENLELTLDESKDYLDYNSEFYAAVYTNKNEEKTIDDFLYRENSLRVKVDTIRNIEDILNKCDFEDIVCWMLGDTNLYQHLIPLNETNDESCISGIFKGCLSSRTVNKAYMRNYLVKVFSRTNWIQTKSGYKANCTNIIFNNYNLSPVVETFYANYEKLKKITNRFVRNEVIALFEKLGVVDDIVDLPKETIYEVLLRLPELDDSNFNLGKSIYSQINISFDSVEAEMLTKNNDYYDLFIEHGKVLAKLEGKLLYLPHEQVFYVENKTYSNDILNRIPTLVLGRRAGQRKIEKLFGVKPIDSVVKAKVISQIEHSCNQDFLEYYNQLLPYLYSRRIGKDNKLNDLKNLRKTKIILVSSAQVEYTSNDKPITSPLDDYELIISDYLAVIKIPADIKTIDELKQVLDFRKAFSEIITTIFKVDADRDIYMTMLSCRDFQELERYLKDDDENLVSLNKSKEFFGTQIDYKEEFWNAIGQCKNLDAFSMKEKYENMLDDTFDYTNPNPQNIVSLFKEIGIDIPEYNNVAYFPVHVNKYFNNLFCEMKRKYRTRYFIYKANELNKNNGTKEDFDVIVNNFDFQEHQFKDSVTENIEAVFEELIGIKIEIIKNLNGDLDQLIESLPLSKEEHASAGKQNIEEQKTIEQEIDFASLNEEMANCTDGTVVEGVTEKPNFRKLAHKNGSPKLPPRTFDPNSTKKKDLIGFLAESKVYNALLKLIGNKGSVSWISANGEKAKKVTKGDDTAGYDIKYTLDGNLHYVEVKGTSGKVVEFNLSKNEYEFGDSNKDKYELWFVFIDEENVASDPIKIGNIFKFDNNESFFHNSRFSVEQSEFKIKAKLVNKE